MKNIQKVGLLSLICGSCIDAGQTVWRGIFLHYFACIQSVALSAASYSLASHHLCLNILVQIGKEAMKLSIATLLVVGLALVVADLPIHCLRAQVSCQLLYSLLSTVISLIVSFLKP